MPGELKVLGVDLASSKWSNNGSALLKFVSGQWFVPTVPAVTWPTGALTALAMAAAIEQCVKANGIHAVSLDGPQGWRDPNAKPRKGVGRWCEYQVRAQGKTKTWGKSAPQTQHDWIKFCIDVFAALLGGPNAQLANDPSSMTLAPLPAGKYWLLESFPTNSWRTSGLRQLPGKQKVGKNQQLIDQYAAALAQVYSLPLPSPFAKGHDDLQAVVCALPAAALLGGPAVPKASGYPGKSQAQAGAIPAHWVEGLIWDAAPPKGGKAPAAAALLAPPPCPEPEGIVNSSVAVDERDDASEAMLERGVRLFEKLVAQANAGKAIGIGYADFACYIHGVTDFKDITGRSYKPGDSPYVVGLALQVTDAAGGRKLVTANGETIEAGMDTFVWPTKKPHERADVAFANTPYTQTQWRTVFPSSKRQLVRL